MQLCDYLVEIGLRKGSFCVHSQVDRAIFNYSVGLGSVMTTLTSFGSCSSEYEGRDKNGTTHLEVSNFCARMFFPCFFLFSTFWPISANPN